MAYRLTITAADMREINRSAILEIIRRESPISRSAIAERLDVSLPTVMRIVDELIEEGYVRPEVALNGVEVAAAPCWSSMRKVLSLSASIWEARNFTEPFPIL